MQPFFICLLAIIFFLEYNIHVERERNVMALERELEEIGKFLKKIKNINCVKQNKMFVVIDGR